MKRASPQIRNLARQLKAFETPENSSSETDSPATFQVIDRLRPILSTLMGRSGLQALLARALVLAASEVSWLTAVRVIADGELEGLTAGRSTLSAAEFSEGEVELLAQLLGLLMAFIGPALTLRLITQVWPQLSFDDADFSNTPNSEEAR